MDSDRPPFRRPIHTVRPLRPSSPRRGWPWLIIAVFAAVALGGHTFLSYYVDSLWFGSLGFSRRVLEDAGPAVGRLRRLCYHTFLVPYGTFLIIKRTECDAR